MKFFSLKYDDVFREVMSHESIRKQFISDVTGIPLSTIRSARLESPYLWKWHRRQKQGILDVAVVLDDGTKVDIELQVQAGDALTDWIWLFNTGTMEELDMIKTKNAGVLNAISVVRNMNLGRTLRQIYELRLKAKRDRRAEDEYIRDLGREEGIEAFVTDYIEEGFAREQIIAKLIKRFGMSGEEAQAYYERFARSC